MNKPTYFIIPRKTPLHTCFTPSHAKLREDFFIPSLSTCLSEYELYFTFHSITGKGSYMSESWRLGIQRKIITILEAVKDNQGRAFVWSDIDVQFFGPTEAVLYESLGDMDIAFQRDKFNQANTGFFICNANERTLSLWKNVYDMTKRDFNYHDQGALNDLLRSKITTKGLRWGYLPPVFYNPGVELQDEIWRRGRYLQLPNNGKILVHHATATKGVQNKLDQLAYVRDLVETGDTFSSYTPETFNSEYLNRPRREDI